jgi:hypothetical protein
VHTANATESPPPKHLHTDSSSITCAATPKTRWNAAVGGTGHVVDARKIVEFRKKLATTI